MSRGQMSGGKCPGWDQMSVLSDFCTSARISDCSPLDYYLIAQLYLITILETTLDKRYPYGRHILREEIRR